MYHRGIGGGAVNDRFDAERLLGTAEKLLRSRDFVGSRRFAEQAMEAFHLVDGADQIIAVADVLLAAQRWVNNHVDWYGVLQLDPSSDGRDPSAVRRQYRRLALLLDPGRNAPLPGSDRAFKLVSDAWAVLSEPAKKDLYDKELDIAAAHLNSHGGPSPSTKNAQPPVSAPTAFWTGCPHCCHVFQYNRGYEDRNLRCQNCKKAFRGEELPSLPPIVPGTETYYCSWGLFPLGFPGGPNFAGVGVGSAAGDQPWKPSSYIPVIPWAGGNHLQPFNQKFWSANATGGNGEWQAEIGNQRKGKRNESVNKNNFSAKIVKTPKMRTKMAVRKPSKQAAGRESVVNIEQENEGTTENRDDIGIMSEALRTENVNKAFECSENVGVTGEGVDLNFTIDMETTDDILEKLSKIPFLKDGELVMMH